MRASLGEDTLRRLIDQVPGESVKLLANIREALGQDDLAKAQGAAHSLKGMAGNCAATAIADLARRIEIDCVTVDEAKKRAESLKDVIARTERWHEKTAREPVASL